MKNYNKILEAINRGIRFALDDFEDNELQGQTNSKVKYLGGIKEYLEPFVDLGLPSGTLWCKCNLGAENEYDYGDYYAWGELTIKDEYTKENYKYNGKYKPTKLPSKYDVATYTLGENYSIPTKKLWYELLEYTDNKWVENYDGTGVNGQLFVSKINSNSIFIPAAGYRNGSSLFDDGSRCNVLSSNRYTGYSDYAWYVNFFNSGAVIDYGFRFRGKSVRPVINL